MTIDKSALYKICVVMVMGRRDWIGKELEETI